MIYKLGKSITNLFTPGVLGLPDKSAAEGLVVALWGKTFIKYGRGRKPFGVYTAGSSRKVFTLTGERIKVTIPEGIIYQGVANVKIRREE